MGQVHLAGLWSIVRPVLVLLLLGLPVMTGLCVWQTIYQRQHGDDALSRSWADASKSFGGMMVASWVVAYAVYCLAQYAVSALAEMQRSGG